MWSLGATYLEVFTQSTPWAVKAIHELHVLMAKQTPPHGLKHLDEQYKELTLLLSYQPAARPTASDVVAFFKSGLAPHLEARAPKKQQEGKRGPKDTYGCTQFQPGLPEGESEESMEARRKRLTDIYCRSGRQGEETAEVGQLMAATFYLQRRQLNAMPSPTIVNLKSQWPYLFSPKGLIGHFQLLTDMQVLSALEAAMEDCGNMIVDLFKTRPTNAAVKEVLNNHNHSEDLPYKVLKLVMAHFNEDVGGLIVQAEGCATVADMESSNLPVTPRLILLGESQEHHQRWMISMEGCVLCEGGRLGTFTTGLGTLFTTYYTFNLQYQDEAASTLEFVQRCLVGINPERGTKASGHKKRKAPSQVSSFLRKLMDFRYRVAISLFS
ncbi:uncharacterized protein LOC134466134 [Engraulis encrasicolus]|uniref:uncharacterized protein LOC134466134 n=1 Tax=Engraulis encrasicolus TaxID=184585 RepID=UPI002FCE7B4B